MERPKFNYTYNIYTYALELEKYCNELEKELFELKEKIKTGELSDGYHTFNELYHHRAVLFSVIVNQNKSISWKSKKHHDGTMYDGMFIVGIDTPQGQYSYHYDIEPYWNIFDCKELDNAPVWDGHEPKDIDRLFSINYNPPFSESFAKGNYDLLKELVDKETPKKPDYEGDGYSDGELVYDTWICPNCGKSYEVDYEEYERCPHCGQMIDWS